MSIEQVTEILAWAIGKDRITVKVESDHGKLGRAWVYYYDLKEGAYCATVEDAEAIPVNHEIAEKAELDRLRQKYEVAA